MNIAGSSCAVANVYDGSFMRRCPACHALYPDEDRFCEVDGEVLVVERDKKLSEAPTLPVAAPPDDVPIITGPTLLAAGPDIEPERIPTLVSETVGMARRFEKANLAWQPQPEDFVLVENVVGIASARGIFRRTGPFDARPALRALGEALLDAPVALCTTAIVRLLSDPTLPALSPDDAITMLESGEQLAPERSGASAVLAHVGYKRTTQQDFVHSHAEDGWTFLALCDGVSGSADGALAARIGSAAALERAGELMRASESLDHVARESIMAAHRAVCAAVARPARASSRPPGPLAADRTREPSAHIGSLDEPPGATIVVAAIRGSDVAIGWAGDSRAYLASDAPTLLTHDHSWANAMLATGHVTEEEAFAQPLAYALTRCIGPLDDVGVDLVPDVRVSRLTPGSALVLCSDGVWSYLAKPEAMAAMVGCADHDAAEIARALVHEALLRGGHDNVSVAVYVV
jgi:serine/threonine protein phosphatase PrpC